MRARRAAAAALAFGLSAGCTLPGPEGPHGSARCVDEAREDGTCYPPSQATIEGWIADGAEPERVQVCLRLHPDGDLALEGCVLGYTKLRVP